MTIYARLRELVLDDGLDPAAAADLVLADPAFLELVRPLIIGQAARFVRADTRAAERKVAAAGGLTRPEARRLLAGRSFATPDGRFVAWLDATADDHEARSGWLRGQAAACIETAHLHARAAELLRSTDAGSLSEVPEDLARTLLDELEGAA